MINDPVSRFLTNPNPKTVAKWRKRQTVKGLRTGPREPRATILTGAEEATVVAFRRHTLLPWEVRHDATDPSDRLSRRTPRCPVAIHSASDTLSAASVPGMRYGISRLPNVEGDKPKQSKFRRDPIGFLHIDIAEVQIPDGKLFVFVGIDRTSKFAVTRLVDKADRKTVWESLQRMPEAVPYQIHTIPPDRASGRYGSKPAGEGHSVRPKAARKPQHLLLAAHALRDDLRGQDRARHRSEDRVERHRAPPNKAEPPLGVRGSGSSRGAVFPNNGQVERTRRTIRNATVKRFHEDDNDQRRTYLADFMAACNFARRLKPIVAYPI